ncbi:MAG: gliding motility-associated C-terminal domain-containing protein [Chitinophagales bacterium]
MIRIRTILIALFLLIAGSSFAITVIDSTTAKESRCSNNGSITVYAHGTNPPIMYALVSGPATRPLQSGSSFSALAPGTYQVLAVNFNNDSALRTVTVTGSYTSPNFNPTYIAPICRNGTTGRIFGNPVNTVGRAPFSWTLTPPSGSPITQSNDTFNNLGPGTYQLKLTDSCGNFTSRSITLNNPNTGLTFSYLTNTVVGCDSISMYIRLLAPSNSTNSTYTIRVYKNGVGGPVHPVVNPINSPTQVELYEVVSGATYGTTLNVTVYNSCGDSVNITNAAATYALIVTSSSSFINCQSLMTATLNLTLSGSQRLTNIKAPFKVLVIDSATNTRVDSVRSTTPNYYVNLNSLPYNKTYIFQLTDGCGRTVSVKQRFTQVVTPATVSKFLYPFHCRDSTISYKIKCNDCKSGATLTMLSGPTNIGSSKPKFSYRDTLIYNFSSTTTLPLNEFFLSNLGPGKYKFRLTDSCSANVVDSFTITPADVADERVSLSYRQGCAGQNKLYDTLYTRHTTAADVTGYGTVTYTGLGNGVNISKTFTYNSTTGYRFVDSVTNLSGGSYQVAVAYALPSGNGIRFNQGGVCFTYVDTVVLPQYNPPTLANSSGVKCHNTLWTQLVADSTRGVTPYQYEIIGGPQTKPIQSSNFFALTLPGSYTARISDACGNAGVSSFTVDTTAFPPIHRTGSACSGGRVTLYSTASSFVTYVWQKPNGTLFTGDTLVLNPVSGADTGVYRVTRYVNINGCKDTLTTNYRLYTSVDNNLFDTICEGGSVRVGTHVYTATGIYHDTLPGVSCDSIINLSLRVNPLKRDTATVTLCGGGSYTQAGHTYTVSGTYRDTMPTTGCDSIRVLFLTISPPKISNPVVTICEGQSFVVGALAYNSSGTYTDTLQVNGCDSIVHLQLTVNPIIRDTVNKTICAGTTWRVGTHVYSTAGTYRDTIATVTCDSLVLTNLSIQPLTRDSVATTICEGFGVNVGTHYYTATGVYRDTFTTASCDSIHILKLTVTPLKRDSVAQRICFGTSVTVGSHVYTASGIYRDTFNTVPCDSIHVLNLTIALQKRDSLVRTICQGQAVTVGTHSYNSTGIYRDTLTTSFCDSIVILNLRVNPLKYVTLNPTICEGQGFRVGSKTYTTPGTYQDTLPTISCDSIITLNLSVLPLHRDTLTRTICEGQIVQVGIHQYNVSGTFRDTLATAGCDSIVLLQLTVTPLQRDSAASTICEGYSVTFGGRTLTQTGIYRDTFATSGCDSISTLNLFVKPLPRDTEAVTICAGDSVLRNGAYRKVAGLYSDTFTTATCDSVYTLQLTVAPLKTHLIDTVICANQFIQVGNQLYATSGVYIDTLPTTTCDSIVTLQLTVLPLIYTQLDTTVCPGEVVQVGGNQYTNPGNYTDTLPTAGCDSVVSLILHHYSRAAVHATTTATDVVRGDTILLSAVVNQPMQYQWTGASFNDPLVQSPTATMYVTSWITVDVVSNDGCKASDSVYVRVRECGNVTLYVPSAFSPNNDGSNDAYRIYGNFVTLNQLSVFNRWGEKVFETDDMEHVWDGTYQGQLQQPGTYVYFLNYRVCGDPQSKTQKGTITLVR